jgi:hypothetical protein
MINAGQAALDLRGQDGRTPQPEDRRGLMPLF